MIKMKLNAKKPYSYQRRNVMGVNKTLGLTKEASTVLHLTQPFTALRQLFELLTNLLVIFTISIILEYVENLRVYC